MLSKLYFEYSVLFYGPSNTIDKRDKVIKYSQWIGIIIIIFRINYIDSSKRMFDISPSTRVSMHNLLNCKIRIVNKNRKKNTFHE